MGGVYPTGEGTPPVPLTRVHALQYPQLSNLLLPHLDPSSTDEGVVQLKVLTQPGLPQAVLHWRESFPTPPLPHLALMMWDHGEDHLLQDCRVPDGL